MQVTLASEAAPGSVNEDRLLAGPSWVVLLDGATAPQGVDSGCRHDVRWLVDHLAVHLGTTLTLEASVPLPDILAGAVTALRRDHEHTCDLDNPHSPSSTVAVVRVRDEELFDYLVLADSAVLIDIGGDVTCVTDDRLDHLPGYSLEVVGALRNRHDGFWVASTSPEAAYQAVTGTVPAGDVRRAALVSDGASRHVELLGLGGWAGLLDALATRGPEAVIADVRDAERAQLGDDPRGPHGRRIKKHDDAAAAYISF